MDFNLIKTVQQKYLKKNLPEVRVGDKIVVSFRIKEGSKERVQNFEGIVIAMRGQGTAKMVKVRKIALGSIGVERTFPINTPTVAGIKIIKRGSVRRAKLFYLRDRIGKKATKIKEGKMKEGEALLWEAVADVPESETEKETEKVEVKENAKEDAVEEKVEDSKKEDGENEIKNESAESEVEPTEFENESVESAVEEVKEEEKEAKEESETK